MLADVDNAKKKIQESPAHVFAREGNTKVPRPSASHSERSEESLGGTEIPRRRGRGSE